MHLYEKKWWKRVFGREKRAKSANTLSDIEAVHEFLHDSKNDLVIMLAFLEEFEELEKEREVATPGILHVNLQRQTEVMDKLLEHYSFFEDDVAINGIRVKEMAKKLLKHAEHAGMHDLVKEKKENPHWQGKW